MISLSNETLPELRHWAEDQIQKIAYKIHINASALLRYKGKLEELEARIASLEKAKM